MADGVAAGLTLGERASLRLRGIPQPGWRVGVIRQELDAATFEVSFDALRPLGREDPFQTVCLSDLDETGWNAETLAELRRLEAQEIPGSSELLACQHDPTLRTNTALGAPLRNLRGKADEVSLNARSASNLRPEKVLDAFCICALLRLAVASLVVNGCLAPDPPMRLALVAVVLIVAMPAFAAAPPSDKEKIRAQAEHDCYDDVQKLCSDVVPDEDKVKACMTQHHSQLSPTCVKDFDAGMGK